ncbi:ClbS/DfsB family four-helix bundle protein [Lactococcus lactis]|uniref:ClbS/DfsB family four-helix bundle protein n=1 Tax=Lactococcus lactis TaxID=1358 RepID=UPI0030F3A9EB
MMESNNYEYLVWREHPTKSKRKLSISSCENLNFGCHFEKVFKNDKMYLIYSRGIIMARAQSKEELITFSEESWQKLCSLINSLNEETKNTNFTFKVEDKKEKHWARDKNLRDVMVHLYEWHQLLINFVEKNKRGEKTPFLPSPYNWKNYGEMNDNFQINGQKKIII